MLRLVLVAAPGAGKGTQGQLLAEFYGVPHISTGDIFRDHVSRGTTTGTLVAAALRNGELVPDAVVLRAITEAISATPRGFVLDGFPRTLEQAIAAEQPSLFGRRPLDGVIELEVSDKELFDRLERRSAKLARSDDSTETIEYRLLQYRRHAGDLLSYYRRRGILITVDGSGPVDAVAERILVTLDAVLGLAHEGPSAPFAAETEAPIDPCTF